ncbi:MAG TPA: aldo/keto reductase, partial [Herpetosiphonaceae bacterium]|nr:aldo/keto reductase [Herpetosiphonaceae bacterium]
AEQTRRSETDQIAKRKYDATADTDQEIVERVAEIAANQGVARSQIALAWLLQKTPVTAPIVGATTTAHLDAAIGALAVRLAPDEVAALEAPYVPHPVVGHQ